MALQKLAGRYKIFLFFIEMYLLYPAESHSDDTVHTQNFRAQNESVILESDLLLLFPHLQGQYSRPQILAAFLGTPSPHHCRCHDPCTIKITYVYNIPAIVKCNIFISQNLHASLSQAKPYRPLFLKMCSVDSSLSTNSIYHYVTVFYNNCKN